MNTTTPQTTPPPPWPRASRVLACNATAQQRAISRLVQSSAETLFSRGSQPHARVRIISAETSTREGV